MVSICRRLLAGGGAALTLLTLLVAAAPAASAQAPARTHSGHAYAVGLTGIKVLGTLLKVGDVKVPGEVSLPPQGGSVQGALGTVALPADLGSVVVARADVQGDHDQSNAHTSVAEVTVLPAGIPASLGLPVQVQTGVAVLTAQVLTASAAVDCPCNVRLDSKVASLSILGLPVDLSAAKNGVLEVKIGGQVAARVRVNAQDSVVAGGAVWGSVSALEVAFPADGPLAALLQGTITLSHAEAGISGCLAASPTARPGMGGGLPDQPSFPATGRPSLLTRS